MHYFAHYRDFIGVSAERFFKTTIFQSPRMLAGMDCLEPGQRQDAHRHAGRDKVYFVVSGMGLFHIGDEVQSCGPGSTIWAPADVAHGVANTGSETLVMFIVMAPEPG
ncbi:cupin domain-containing protein [Candidatus Gracilibacteria bacterium]|nr:cupin domain-containing protein [Candidatus Gracilibacteria bacterium]